MCDPFSSQPFKLPHPNLSDFDRTNSTPNLASKEPKTEHARSRSDSKDDSKKSTPKSRGTSFFKKG